MLGRVAAAAAPKAPKAVGNAWGRLAPGALSAGFTTRALPSRTLPFMLATAARAELGSENCTNP